MEEQFIRAATNTCTLFNKDLSNAYYVTGSVLCTWDTLNKTDKDTNPSDFTVTKIAMDRNKVYKFFQNNSIATVY